MSERNVLNDFVGDWLDCIIRKNTARKRAENLMANKVKKFRLCDLVSIGPLPASMSHFTGAGGGKRGIVVGCGLKVIYRDAYTLHIEGCGESSWYDAEHLTLIQRDAGDLLDEWENTRASHIERLLSARKVQESSC